MKRFSVVPAFNEEKTIANVVKRLRNNVDTVVVVNDCSSDDTSLAASKEGAVILNNLNNEGYESSLIKGLRYAYTQGADSIITFDADGQHPFNKVDTMFKLIESNTFDIVVGSRASLPRISERIFSTYTYMKYGIPDILCGLKCYSSRALKATGFHCEWNSIGTFITLKALRLGLPVTHLPIPTATREYGFSRFGISIKSEADILFAFIASVSRLRND